MPDSNDKSQNSKPKTLSNSLRLKSPNSVKSRQSVSQILDRLPLIKKLNATQNQLLSITPIWQKWCSDQASSISTEYASPASIKAGVLTISCKQSSTATILKHQQNSLLDALKNAGFEQIQTISIQMSLNHAPSELTKANNQIPIQTADSRAKNSDQARGAWSKPSAASLKSIEATQALTKNEQLAASLKRLAETLKKAP